MLKVSVIQIEQLSNKLDALKKVPVQEISIVALLYCPHTPLPTPT